MKKTKQQRERWELRGGVAVRALGDGEGGEGTVIEGYAAVFNEVSFGEVIRRGAFAKTLRESKDIRAYWSHDWAEVLARTTNGTLVVEEDAHGLKVWMKPNGGTTWGRDALASVSRGDVNQMSFGFEIIQSAKEVVDGVEVRVILEVRLYEVSLVAEPWYPGTSAMVRKRGEEENIPLNPPSKGDLKDTNDDGGEAPGPVHAGHPTREAASMKRKKAEIELLERNVAS